jgi:4-amino-4-deoxy-L-arabinose transferase-like glycosyltransferase
VTHRTHRFLLSAILVYAGIVRLLPGIARYDFGSAWDEGYYAIAATGAAHRAANWLYPFIYERSLDHVLINKPPAFFWLGALALHLPFAPELALRLVSVVAGVASVAVFEALCRMFCRRSYALLAATAFASNPVHVALSRVYQMDVIALFYALASTYLLLGGIRRRSRARILCAGLVLGLGLLTKLWAAALPVVALLPFLLCEARRRRTQALGIFVVLAYVLGALVFAVWPVALWLRHGPYSGFLWMRPGASVWDLLFFRYGTSRYESPAMSVAERFFAPYLSLGHFRIGTPFLAIGVAVAVAGAAAPFATGRTRKLGRLTFYRAVPVLLWTLAYLPIAGGKDHYLQYLIVLLPVWSILVGNALSTLLGMGRGGVASCALLTITALTEPIYLVLHGDEILYATHYREMGAFIAARETSGPGLAECRYAPGLSYYTGHMEKPYDGRWPIERGVARGVVRFVDVKRSRRDNTLTRADRRWVKENCTDVSVAAGLPREGLHALYDCARAPDR